MDFEARIAARAKDCPTLKKAILTDKNAKWRVVSALQKAIRRGDTDQAVLTASALYNSGEEGYMHRRLCVIGLEDIAFGDMPLLTDLFAYFSSKPFRLSLPPEIFLCLVRDMCETPIKDRSPNEFNTSFSYSPTDAPAKAEALVRSTKENADTFYNPEVLLSHRLAAGLAIGGALHDGNSNYKLRKRAASSTKLWREGLDYVPEEMAYVCSTALAFGGELTSLPTGMRLVYEMEKGYPAFAHSCPQPKPEAVIVNGLISPAFDMHTFEGKKCVAYFRKACPELVKWAEVNKIEDARSVIGDALFEVEGKWCDGRMFSKLGMELDALSHKAEAEKWGVDFVGFDQLMEIVTQNLPLLNEIRTKILSNRPG